MNFPTYLVYRTQYSTKFSSNIEAPALELQQPSQDFDASLSIK